MLAYGISALGGGTRSSPDAWTRAFFMSAALFPIVSASVAATWAVLAIQGRWRPARDWIDWCARAVCVAWFAIGVAWLLRIYLNVM
jgi:hypothetical protein